MSASPLAHPPAATAGRLTGRRDDALPGHLGRSAHATGSHADLAAFRAWFEDQRATARFRVTPVPFAELNGWSFDADSGNLVHRSGKFFTIEGLHVTSDTGPVPEWHQPIIRQHEVGILGLLVKEFDGVPHFLLQAKMEPGNPNGLQLSPTVQATRSNFTKVHGGSAVKYIEYFAEPGRGRIVTDSLQSEHGSWFLHKSNRNMAVATDEDVVLHDNFHWLTLAQIGALLREDNVINMDTRTVLSCLPVGVPEGTADGDTFTAALLRSSDPASGALHPDLHVMNWMAHERSRRGLVAHTVPMAGLPGWRVDDMTVSHVDGRYFDVMGVDIEAGSREVATWCQPLIEPRGEGVTAFLAKRVDGVLHLLAHARAEAGFHDTVQIAPTVQYTPGNYDWLPADRRPRYFDLVLRAPASDVRYSNVHAEEGGRFRNAVSSYRVVEVAEDFEPSEPSDYRWITVAQLDMLCNHENRVNVQARTLLACLKLAMASQ